LEIKDKIMRAKCALIRAGCVGGKILSGGILISIFAGIMFISVTILDKTGTFNVALLIGNIVMIITGIIVCYLLGNIIFNELDIQICKRKK
jgi:hypothetical protein